MGRASLPAPRELRSMSMPLLLRPRPTPPVRTQARLVAYWGSRRRVRYWPRVLRRPGRCLGGIVGGSGGARGDDEARKVCRGTAVSSSRARVLAERGAGGAVGPRGDVGLVTRPS